MATVKIAEFNRGRCRRLRNRYAVPRSLLNSFKYSMLYRSATEAWQKHPTEHIFIGRNGDRFQYCRHCLRDDKATIPFSVPISALIADAQYYRITVRIESVIQQIENCRLCR